MYLQHFGLKRFPFDITSDPEFLWAGENHRQALSVLQEGVFENRGFVVLTGEVGTGKTTLINAFRRLDDIATIIVTIPDPDMEVLDLFNFLAHEFEIGKTFQTPEAFVHTFKSLLLQAYASYRKVLIVIDEAQRLNDALLVEISKLAKIEMAGRRLLKIFFVGQLEFKNILVSESNKEILEEVVAAHTLEPIRKAEIPVYINHRLKIAGCEKAIFSADSLAKIYTHTGGLPRSINVLCDRALLAGFLAGSGSINHSIIEHSAQKIRLPSQNRPVTVADLPVSKGSDETVEYDPGNEWATWKTAGWICLLLIFLMVVGYLTYYFVMEFDLHKRILRILIELLTKFSKN